MFLVVAWLMKAAYFIPLMQVAVRLLNHVFSFSPVPLWALVTERYQEFNCQLPARWQSAAACSAGRRQAV